MGLLSLKSPTTNTTQNTSLTDNSANAGGDNSLALSGNANFETSTASAEAGGVSLSNSTLNVVSDLGTIDVAKELSLESLNLARKQTTDLKEYVQSNQNFARSIAETALAAGTAQPLPNTSKNFFYVIGGAIVAVIVLVFALAKKSR